MNPVSEADEKSQQQSIGRVRAAEKNLGSEPFAGPKPPADRRLVLVQRRRLGLLFSSVVSSAAAVMVAASLSLLVIGIVCRKHR